MYSVLLLVVMGVLRACVGSVAPIHPGSIPSPGVGASSVAQLALQSRTSIGGGISPVLLAQVSFTALVMVTSGYATMVHGRGCNPHHSTTTFANVEITSLMTS